MSYEGSPRQPRGRVQSLYPATIKQLLRAEQSHPQSSFFVDGIKLDMVTCVANIVDIREYNSGKAYVLEDGSGGRIFVWSETNPRFECHVGEKYYVYVRVIGQLKIYNGVNQLIATHTPMTALVYSTQGIPSALPPLPTANVSQSPPSVQRHASEGNGPEEDPTGGADEITWNDVSDATFEEFDRLALINRHDEELNEAGLSRQPTSLPQQQPPRPPSRPSVDPLLTASSQPSLLQDPYSSLSPLQRAIMVQLYDNAPSSQMVFHKCDISEIRQEIEDMMDGGLLYSTIDLDHFRMVD
ncbi:hypothetical protein BGW80DRAFT_1268957 [Lactifluus volemus]|nr:hypothetical protein BGW80DRAFT_1268957 [Lactifluus volemus]